MEHAAIRIAETLMNEHQSGARYHPFAAAFGIANVDDAYAVQREYVRLQMQSRGTGVAGYKIGLTSKRMQEMCGIDSPNSGVILQDRVHGSGATLSAAAYGRIGLEFEIAVRIGRDLLLDGHPFTPEDVAAAVDAVCPAIEVIDDRNADYGTLEALSLIADNSWNAGIVLGEFARPWPDPASTQGIVFVDGAAIDRGSGRDVLGHPFHAVAWLAGHLADSGTGLRAGDVIMTGSVVTTKYPDRPAAYRFEAVGLGGVELTLRR
jgi:2-keto-4-pentenoate hydratase